MKATRRALLASGVTMTACAALPRRPAAPAVRFAVRTPFATKDLRERAELLARLGYDGIELGHEFLDRSAESLLGDLRGTGIRVSAIVGSIKLLAPDVETRRAGIQRTRERLSLAQALGAVGVIEVPTFGPCAFGWASGDPARHRGEDDLLVDALAQLAPDVARTDVKILLEPLTKKATHFMNLQEHASRIIDAVGAPGIRLLSDFYHMQLEEPDVGDTLARWGGYTGYVHLADGEARSHPGSLPFDYRPGFRSLKRHGFSGWLTMEFRATAGTDPTAALARGLAYAKEQWSAA